MSWFRQKDFYISDENVTVSLCIHLFIEGLGITKRYVAQFYQYYGSLESLSNVIFGWDLRRS